MCYILAYVIFIPIAKELAARLDNPSVSTAILLALGELLPLLTLSITSPVIISAVEELFARKDKLFILGLFIAVLTSIAGYLYFKIWKSLKL